MKRILAERFEMTRVLLEGGPTTLARAIAQEALDELWTFTAPKILDGNGMRALLPSGQPPLEHIDHAQNLRLMEVKKLGEDVMCVYRF